MYLTLGPFFKSPKDKKKPKAFKLAPIEEKILLSQLKKGQEDCNG